MGRPASTCPTVAEMELITLFDWMPGKAGTIRDVVDLLRAAGKQHAYTSAATIVRIMLDKRYLTLADARRPQKFQLVISLATAQRQICEEIVHRQFGGDAEKAAAAFDELRKTRKGAA